MDTTLIPAAELDLAQLAALFTTVYEGYWHPIEIDAPALERMVATYDLDLRGSRVALAEDGEPIGLAMLARRGADSWVGGMGVVAGHRGRGLGEALTREILDVAHTAGCTRTRLEVLEQNAPAIAIYRRLGFRHLRDVAVWSLAAPPAAENAEPVDLDAALATLERLAPDDPWQRSLPTIARMHEAGAELAAYAVRGGTAVYAPSGGRAALLAIDADPDTAPALLRAPFAHGAEAVLWLNGAAEGPVADALVAVGAAQLGRQHELALDLVPTQATGIGETR